MAMSEAGRLELDRLRMEQGLQLELPWGGRSPRVLTHAHIRFSLSQRDGEDDLSDAMIDEQYRRFHYGF